MQRCLAWNAGSTSRSRSASIAPLVRKMFERARRLVFPAEYPYFNLGLERQTHERLRQLIDEFQPTVAVVDHWLNAIIPSPLRHRTFPVVVASHDVEWQLTKDLTSGKAPLLRRLRGDAEVWYFRRVEARLYREADRTWAVSEKDRIAIQRFAGLDSQVRTLPAVIELDRYEAVRRHTLAPERPRASSGPTLMYAGGYAWSPNADAAHALITDIFPRVRERYPDARLLLVGQWPTAEMQAAARADAHIVVTGEVADVRPYLMEADIVPVPLLVGGGMRVKILEAFAAGVPVVSTTKGAEGIQIADGRELLVRDGIPAFVDGIAELWENPERARQLAEHAFDFMRREHSMELLEARVRAEVLELM